MIYLDTSALAKLVVDESESAALAEWLDARADEVLCTSTLTRVELLRAAARHSEQAVPHAHGILAELALIPMDSAVVDVASALPPKELRSLDAVHIASAASLSAVATATPRVDPSRAELPRPANVTVVAYDHRLLEAAERIGLDCASPGR